MPPPKKPGAKRQPAPAKANDGFTSSLLIRISPDLIKRIDTRVKEMKGERPGMSRSDFVREAVIRALRDGDES